MNRKEKYSLILDYLKEQKYSFRSDDELTLCVIPFQGDINCNLTLSVQETSISASVFFPARIPESSRVAVLEFINMINFNNYTGYCVMDPRDGEISFRLVTFLPQKTLSHEDIDLIIGFTYGLFQTYAQSIMRITYGNSLPLDEFEGLQTV